MQSIIHIFAFVKTIFPILTSLLIVFQSFNIHFGDVLKFSEILEHADLHKEKYGDNFMVFISKHYGELKASHKKQHQEEERDHSHTPINHDCSSQLQSVFVMNLISLNIENSSKEIKITENFYYQDKFTSFEKQRIFQPPQVA